MEVQSARSARLHTYGNLDSITVEETPIPDLQDTQVLIRVECAPINVSDLAQALGGYVRKSLPFALGNEGSGTVIKSGSSEHAQSLVGKRVSFIADSIGTYSEYSIASAFNVFPLRDSVTFEQGASLIINPMTVAYMVEKLRAGNHTSVVIDAAASALGKMLIRWCKLLNIATVNLVRRQEQVDILTSLGAEHVFNTSNEGWKDAAKAITHQHGTRIGFDAIAGSATQDMLDLLVEEGIVYVYGGLSGQPAQANPMTLIGGDKTIRGLWLINWLKVLSAERKVEVGYEIQDLIDDALKTDYQSEVGLDGVKDAFKQYSDKKTDSKFLVRPSKA